MAVFSAGTEAITLIVVAVSGGAGGCCYFWGSRLDAITQRLLFGAVSTNDAAR